MSPCNFVTFSIHGRQTSSTAEMNLMNLFLQNEELSDDYFPLLTPKLFLDHSREPRSPGSPSNTEGTPASLLVLGTEESYWRGFVDSVNLSDF